MSVVTEPTVVILAAGQGTRMKSSLPKVLHPICGRPMILWPVVAALEAGAARVVVVDDPSRKLDGVLPEGVTSAVQAEPRGTGDAVRAAADLIDPSAPVVVLAGDVPLITAEAISELVAAHAAGDAVATMATMELDDPAGYGRVIRGADGAVERVVETKLAGDATPAELEIREVNTGVLVFDGQALLDALGGLHSDNAQGELYLPDVLPILRAAGHRVGGHVFADPRLMLGVNDRVDLATVTRHAQQRINEGHMRAGVTFLDAASSVVDAGVGIGRDTVIEPFTCLYGSTRIGEDCRIGPSSTLIDSELGAGVTIRHTYADGAFVEDGATVGPFAYLRPGATLRPRAKVGTFVEVKNATIGANSKVPHLSYVGDADVGQDSNLGAGTITVNYDGRRKHRTTIGSNVRGGSDTMFIAPVTVGDGAWTAAGSVITKDIPPGALGVARARQHNVEGYVERRAREQEEQS
ncbi:MAG: N-acetylglucosamine-1-phosphate uridyltransferase / Glucosamine-1-phosphate N-acetyltransferase [uncultured Solirubrobacteraceae bacterium]|uniref:Bifunctional protein GlmU n=1 Tax=uncultured Solirubrobacteraceae bacterium TaxID=1162706 RepID=A0A6J4S1K7_9ACTN|nr:MAG: N-acetylglucosamine-1-phosphate uridyltransferase / Glucosamine-1-phosphate N-acetyltransferase [uncultured Solirubrobacteraceae bacterium]